MKRGTIVVFRLTLPPGTRTGLRVASQVMIETTPAQGTNQARLALALRAGREFQYTHV